MHTTRSGMRLWPAMLILAGAWLTAVPLNLYADPPPWAPAHGWRKKNDPNYVGYTGKKWDQDYGVATGQCNRQAVGAVIGGVVGGAVGSQVGKGSGRDVAILVGTVAGAMIGAQIGRDMDRTDQACIAHALELAATNKRVTWPSADNRATYVLTPGDGFQRGGQTCREFSLRRTAGSRTDTAPGRACRTGDGTWQIIS